MKYSNLTLGQIEAIVNKLGGIERVKQLLDNTTRVTFMDAKSGDDTSSQIIVQLADQPIFDTWTTVKLGTGLKTPQDFHEAIIAAGFEDWFMNDIFKDDSDFTTSQVEQEVDLVIVSVKELGFKKQVSRREIYERALSLGLQLCPAEVAPQLVMQYPNIRQVNDLCIGMEPFLNKHGWWSLFEIGMETEAKISLHHGEPTKMWVLRSRFVFVKPRQ